MVVLVGKSSNWTVDFVALFSIHRPIVVSVKIGWFSGPLLGGSSHES
jgi:hypothetical protein